MAVCQSSPAYPCWCNHRDFLNTKERIKPSCSDMIPLKQTRQITKIYLGGIFMSKSPDTPEFRVMVSQEYLNILDSYRFPADKYQIGCKTLKE